VGDGIDVWGARLIVLVIPEDAHLIDADIVHAAEQDVWGAASLRGDLAGVCISDPRLRAE
jgi:hypothetical protein